MVTSLHFSRHNRSKDTEMAEGEPALAGDPSPRADAEAEPVSSEGPQVCVYGSCYRSHPWRAALVLGVSCICPLRVTVETHAGRARLCTTACGADKGRPADKGYELLLAIQSTLTPKVLKQFGWNAYVQVGARVVPEGVGSIDDAFVHDSMEGTPKPAAAGSSLPEASPRPTGDSQLIPSDDDSQTEGSDDDSDGDESSAFPGNSENEVKAPLQARNRPIVQTRVAASAGNDEPSTRSNGPAKGSAQAPPPPAWAEDCDRMEVDDAESEVPRAFGERAGNPAFVLAEHALRAAEEVRLAGNDAFFAGRFEEAQELYKVAGRHLETASNLESPADLAVPGYSARKLECTEKSKLNLAACRIKLGDYPGCIEACQEILKVAPGSVKVACLSVCAYVRVSACAFAFAFACPCPCIC